MHTKKMFRMLGAVAASVLLMTSTADATVKCRAAVIKESGKITQAVAKLLQKCEEGVRAGKIVGPCPDAGTAGKIAGAKLKTRAAVEKACTGASGEFNFGSCPDAQGPNGAATCKTLVTSKADQGDCLACLGEENAQESAKLSYGSFVNAGGDKVLGKCQATIGKAAAGFFVARSKILGKCQAGVVGGKLSGPCPSGDQKTVDAIEKARVKMESAVCKACGGPDKLCDGVDDLTPAAIGFADPCPLLQVGGSAGLPVTTLGELVECLETQNVVRTDCTDKAALPYDVAYPSTCSAATSECTDDGGSATIQVSITSPIDPFGGVSVSIGYRDVIVPGTGSAALAAVSNLQGGLIEANDGEDAVIVSVTDLGGLAAGALFTVAVDTCAGPPSASDFSCVVRSASTIDGAEVLEGVTCSVSVL